MGQTLLLSRSFSFAFAPPVHHSLHGGTSGSAFSHYNRQRFKLREGLNAGKEQAETRDRARQRQRMDGVRRGDIRKDTVQQTESYGDIWRIHEAVMNLFSFFYRST